MLRFGGLVIFLGVIVGYFVGGLYDEKIMFIIIGVILIVMMGVLDDKYGLLVRIKLIG